MFGQENITKILKNQIKSNNIAHAYLFSGIRGTGKTSAAKIFARAVNCLNLVDGNPCNKCEVCKGILNESIMDIVEIDAASNNKVDDIRELKENSNYPPSSTRYKVYIVDEVHMLSKGAFNAFLKTLEEPPDYVIFILATTEENKIPATILSRCQRYEFKRIPNYDIVKNMNNIVEDMDILAEASALKLIARNSGGSMRDALSILDQCLSIIDDDKLKLKDVIQSIGSVDLEFTLEVAEAIIKSDSSKVICKFDELRKGGKDYTVFLKELISLFRDTMILKTEVEYDDIIELSDEDILEIKKISEDISISEIIEYIEKLLLIEENMRKTDQPGLTLELSLVKLSEMKSYEDLYLKINKIENFIENNKMIINSEKVINEKNTIKTINKNRDIKNYEEKKQEHNQENSNENIDKSFITQQRNSNLNIEDIRNNWNSFIKVLRKERPSIGALIMEAKIKSFNENILKLEYEQAYGFHKEAITREDNLESLKIYLRQFFKSEMEVNIKMSEDMEHNEKSESTTDEYVQDVISIFGEDKVNIE